MSRNKDYQKLLNGKRWLEVKRIVWQRAKGRCERCLEEGFITPGRECHHIIPVESAISKGIEAMAELAYNVNNVRLLCRACHKKTHKEMHSHTEQMKRKMPKQDITDNTQQQRLKNWIESKGGVYMPPPRKGIRKTQYGWMTLEEFKQRKRDDFDKWKERINNGFANAER